MLGQTCWGGYIFVGTDVFIIYSAGGIVFAISLRGARRFCTAIGVFRTSAGFERVNKSLREELGSMTYIAFVWTGVTVIRSDDDILITTPCFALGPVLVL